LLCTHTYVCALCAVKRQIETWTDRRTAANFFDFIFAQPERLKRGERLQAIHRLREGENGTKRERGRETEIERERERKGERGERQKEREQNQMGMID
jgi:hypothetical protein